MASIIGGGWLRDDAAAHFNALQHAAKARFGTFMPVTSAGRTKAEQARLYNGWVKRLPGFSPAYPPDSPYALHVVNGGSAVDVGGAFGVAGTTPHLWLKQAGPTHGYAVDAVAGEPWHIQFTLRPAAAASSATPIEGDTLSAAEVQQIIESVTGITNTQIQRATRYRMYGNLQTKESMALNITSGDIMPNKGGPAEVATWQKLQLVGNGEAMVWVEDALYKALIDRAAIIRATPTGSVPGAPIDYAALAKAVNDDAARRLQA